LPDESGDPHLSGGCGEWRSQVRSSGSYHSKLTGPNGRPSRSIACRWPLCSTITEQRFSAISGSSQIVPKAVIESAISP